MNKQTKSLLSQLKLHLLEIDKERLSKIILFGSQSRGTAHQDSDIDILIVLKGEVNIGDEIQRTGQIISELSLNYDQVISRLFMSEDYFDHDQSALLRNIRTEGIAL
jgi:uncharacterized protein